MTYVLQECKKRTTLGIPTWSSTVVLTLSLCYVRSCHVLLNFILYTFSYFHKQSKLHFSDSNCCYQDCPSMLFLDYCGMNWWGQSWVKKRFSPHNEGEGEGEGERCLSHTTDFRGGTLVSLGIESQWVQESENSKKVRCCCNLSSSSRSLLNYDTCTLKCKKKEQHQGFQRGPPP